MLLGGLIDCFATSAVGEKNKLGTLEKFLGRLPRSFISWLDAAAGFCLKSVSGVYAFFRLVTTPSPLLNLRLMDQAVRVRHPMMTRATKAMQAPTTIKTKFSGKFVFCMYGAFEVGGTEGGG